MTHVHCVTLCPFGKLSGVCIARVCNSGSGMQAQADLDMADSQTQLLQSQVEQQQQLLRSLLQRAEAAEHGLKSMQTALTQAEETAASLQQRNNRIELANVMASCVAAFLAASAGTLYLLH